MMCNLPNEQLHSHFRAAVATNKRCLEDCGLGEDSTYSKPGSQKWVVIMLIEAGACPLS